MSKGSFARVKYATISSCMALLIAGCAGETGPVSSVGSTSVESTPSAPAKVSPAAADAYRFLNRATFGATDDDANKLIAIGSERWIENQENIAVSLQLPKLRALPQPADLTSLQHDRVDIWFDNALHGEDQLRQRVAFALSQIFVVSDVSLAGTPYGLASYYDVLAEHAFGNFRELLEAVTLHPAMGAYLSMLGNQKPDAQRNIRPDENFARELMQLFTIGLHELHIDGTERRDSSGRRIETYNQDVIEGFAHVFTGWNYAGPSFWEARHTVETQTVPMQVYESFHDTGPKLLLGGVTLPAGQSGRQDLDAALDNIFNHPNVGPFIAKRLIQRLTTSNPTPAYVARVAQRFNDNGHGERGDLAAVVRAILLDPEVLSGDPGAYASKVKEPLLRLTQLWRAYDARVGSSGYDTSNFGRLARLLGQGPLQSASVFNFFSPFYAPPGEMRDAQLVAPELEIATEYQNALITNLFYLQCISLHTRSPGLDANDVVIDISEETAIALDPTALVDRVARKLLGGAISPLVQAEVIGLVSRIPSTFPEERAANAVYFIATSPDFVVQR